MRAAKEIAFRTRGPAQMADARKKVAAFIRGARAARGYGERVVVERLRPCGFEGIGARVEYR